MISRFLRQTGLGLVSNNVLASCAAAVLCLSAPSAGAQTFLSNSELLEIIPGSTIYSKAERGTPWAQVYSEADGKMKGTVRSIFGKRRYYAKWFVREGYWCENWGSGEACWRVEKVGFNALRLYTRDGKPRRHLWNLKRPDITG
jgi:hypothetical protein